MVSGRTLVSFPASCTGPREAGATAVGERLAVDGGLVPRHSPDDPPAFYSVGVRRFAVLRRRLARTEMSVAAV